MYEVLLERRAEKDLKRLTRDVFERVVSRLRSLSEDPKPSGSRKITGSKNDWRVRVGEYRIIYEIDDRKKAIRVMRIRHRKEVYR